MKQFIYRRFLQPLSQDQDSARREFILNVLLFGLSIIALITLIASVVDLATGEVVNGLASIITTTVFFLIILICRHLARAGWYVAISYALIICLGLTSLSLVLEWSFELPMAELVFALMLVIAGALQSARSALRFAGISLIIFMTIACLQVGHYLHPRTDWLNQPLVLSDAIGYAVIFCIIALVSWLANREIDRSLKRARTSEAALAAERDSLEIKVAERTRELEQTQLLRLMELQRFAEFGRLGANLLHEVANPLTAVSLTLEQMREEGHSKPILQAHRNLQHLERYLTAARKQLKGQGELSTFSIHREVTQLRDIILPNAQKAGVTLKLEEAGNYRLYGDPVKFNQLLANLILNAIEAYADTEQPRRARKVIVVISRTAKYVVVNIQDWGKGIADDELSHIFEPFYSTKTGSKRSMGIGLAIVKRYVTEDFNGTIAVTSTPEEGTIFTVQLKRPKEAA